MLASISAEQCVTVQRVNSQGTLTALAIISALVAVFISEPEERATLLFSVRNVCRVQLLRLLGLKKDLNQAAFRACAEEVEAWDLAGMGLEQRAEALAAARELVQELTGSPSLQGTSLYHAIRDIAFVPASVVRRLPKMSFAVMGSLPSLALYITCIVGDCRA